MSERILIESIKTDRLLNPDDNLDELAASLRDKGQKLPVLLIAGNILVDGLRRLEALKLLGHTTVMAVVATTLEEAVDVLAKASKVKRMSYRRTWEIRQMLDSLVEERAEHNRRKRIGLGRRQPLPDGPAVRMRVLWQEAFIWKHIDNKVWPVYRSGRQDLIEKMETGECAASTANRLLRQEEAPLRGNIQIRREQTMVLQGAARTLSGVVKALEKLGWPLDVDPEEMAPTLRELKQHRAVVSRVVRLLEEAVTK